MNVVLVMFKDDERRDFPLRRPNTRIGRRTDCHLRIPTRDVSREHCELVHQNGKLVARDAGSANGTFVNGKRIAEITLAAGDRLRIGPVTFVVQIDGKPATITPDMAAAAPVTVDKGPSDEPTFDLSDDQLDDEAFEKLDEWEDDKDKP